MKMKNDLRLGCRVTHSSRRSAFQIGLKSHSSLASLKSEPEHQENYTPAFNKTMGAFLILLDSLAQMSLLCDCMSNNLDDCYITND